VRGSGRIDEFMLGDIFLRIEEKASSDMAHFIITIYAGMTYTAPCVLLLMRAASITWASGRGLGHGNQEFFGPCVINGIGSIGEYHLGLQNSRFP